MLFAAWLAWKDGCHSWIWFSVSSYIEWTFHCHLIMSNLSWLPFLNRASLGEMGLLLDSWTIYSICCCYSCPRQTENVKGFYLPSYGEYYRGQMDSTTKYLSLCLTCSIPVIYMEMEFILLCVPDQFNNAGSICGFDATCWAKLFFKIQCGEEV